MCNYRAKLILRNWLLFSQWGCAVWLCNKLKLGGALNNWSNQALKMAPFKTTDTDICPCCEAWTVRVTPGSLPFLPVSLQTHPVRFSFSTLTLCCPSHVFLSTLLLGLIFFSISFFVSKLFLPFHPSLPLFLIFFCSRLVQCEQGLSMKIFNYTSRILDSPLFLFLFSPCVSPALAHSHPSPPFPHPPPSSPLSTLTFLFL